MYKIYEPPEFEKQLNKELSTGQKRQLQNLRQRLSINAFQGKPLGTIWFREFKIQSKRVYFVIFEDIVLLIGVSDKDDQREFIKLIKKRLPDWIEYIKKIKQRA